MAKILVVDDEGFVRDLVRTFLEGAGHQVFEAADGEAALQAFTDSPVDLIITDNAMPRMTGAEMVAELRKEHMDVKVIAMSGLTLHRDAQAGVDLVLQKPFQRADFLRAVSSVLSKQ